MNKSAINAGLTSSDQRIRLETIQQLEASDLRYADSIAVLLSHSESGIRVAAAWAIAKLGAKDYIKQVRSLLQDESSWVRGDAAGALARMEAIECREQIVELCSDKSPGTRAAAIWAIKELGGDGFQEEIEKHIDDAQTFELLDPQSKKIVKKTVSSVAREALRSRYS